MRVELPYNFTPRFYQRNTNRAYFIDRKKYSIDIIHRRGGKSKNAINFITMAALEKIGNYYHTFPELKQARRVIWNGIDKEGKRYLDHIPKAIRDGNANNTEMMIYLINGSTIQLAGADRYDQLMGGNPAGIIFDEYSLMNPLAWHYLSPILTENEGWGKFVYTPRGHNHGYDLYMQNLNNPSWFVQKLDITQTKRNDGTPVITLAQVEERRRSGMPEELIQQEFYCSFDAALANAFYSKEIDLAHHQNRVRPLLIIPELPVHTAWDIGRRDPTSIWFFQATEDKIYLLKYYENVMQSMEFYIGIVRDFLELHRLRNGVNFAPHDIKVHEWTNGLSRIDSAAKMGFYFKDVPNQKIMDGINAVRTLFPKLHFDSNECKIGLNALKQYQRNERGEPVHDFASHPADALRTLATGWHDSYRTETLFQERTLEVWHP